jgi:hypothetical protein
MTNTETFKSKFPGFKGVVNFYTLGNEQINFIDVDADRVEYTYTYTMQCGCCVDRESDVESLSYIMDDMGNTEFGELCLEVAERV